MTRKSFRSLLAADGPLILPGAHDALAARLIQRAGFGGFFIGGFGAVGARFGVPDIGLKSLGDISQAVRDILAACDLPVLVDADDGYGDVKNVVHTVHTYEKMGVGALFLEDQRWPKRCGHLEGKAVVPVEEHAAKIRAAAQERMCPDTFLIARTDARAVTGLDDAMRRAERYLQAGADCIFIEALRTVEEGAWPGRIPEGLRDVIGKRLSHATLTQRLRSAGERYANATTAPIPIMPNMYGRNTARRLCAGLNAVMAATTRSRLPRPMKRSRITVVTASVLCSVCSDAK